MEAFSALARSALAQGALNGKIKELIAIAVSAAARGKRRAVDSEATREEILETLGMAIYMGLNLRRIARATRSALARSSRP
jgi:alkylhydroperoxidase/carboxymuconolactone decarboxylase family protein YurZ